MTTAQEFRDAAIELERAGDEHRHHGEPTQHRAHYRQAALLLAATEQAEQLGRGIDREMALAARIERAEAHVATLTAERDEALAIIGAVRSWASDLSLGVRSEMCEGGEVKYGRVEEL